MEVQQSSQLHILLNLVCGYYNPSRCALGQDRVSKVALHLVWYAAQHHRQTYHLT